MKQSAEDGWQWVHNPARVFPARTLILVLIILAVALVLLESFGLSTISLALFVAFFGSQASALLPTRFEVSSAGVRKEMLGVPFTYPMQRIRRVVPTPSGLYFSPHIRPSRLDRFQGWLIPVPAEAKGEILEFIEERISSRPSQ